MIAVVVVTVLSYAVGWAIGVPWLMPILNAAGAWWIMARELRRGRTTRAVGVMLVWAATMAVVGTVMTAALHARGGGEDVFLRSWYRDEMLAWVRTGVGPESAPSVFVPRHVAYAGVFAAASAGTGGVLSMPMGAMLTNQMSEYVGALAARSPHPIAAAVLGWHPWSIVRVIGFVMIGVVLSGVVLSRVMRFPFSISAERRWLLAGAALLVLDIALKWALAPAWGRLLKGLAGW